MVTSSANDFDFLIGTWDLRHRCLAAVGGSEWKEYDGTAVVRQLMGGGANVDEMRRGDSFAGTTLRLFDKETEQWSIYWADGRYHRLGPPVFGGFRDDKGLFYGDDTHEGKPVRVRFIWTTQTPRWEQAFSFDQEKTWETNWTIDLTRRH